MLPSKLDLIDAAFEGNLDDIKRLLDADPSLVHHVNGENAAIHSAAGNDQSEAITLLLDYGADINAKDEDGMTPLHRAAEGQQLRAARVLVERGALLDLFDPKGYTAAALALVVGQTEIAQLLFQAGATRGLIAASLLAELENVRSILEENPEELARVPSHEMLLSGTIGVDRGSLDDRVQIVKILFLYGLKPDVGFVLQQIDSCRSSNMKMFLPVLIAYAAEHHQAPNS